ncbi:MAG TPA: extracellular solute-binding protein, partial [Solirubrobacterales bacterium]|nr:extracellular solute-binding protein [Solirubrobacterales bacterium]
GDVEVLEPNPFTSGGAKWNIMAAYGAQLEQGKSPAEAQQYLAKLFENVPVLDKSARESLQTFSSGKGDVLLGYENEAIKAIDEGEDVEFIVPPSTIQIETPIAVTTDAPEPAAEDFLNFIWSDEGQNIWAENGYRPVNPKLVDEKQFPTPADLFTIDQFGGWDKVNDEFFDDETGSVAKIEAELGVSTSG